MSGRADVLCFSHLRWGFVYQRPNHLMSRCARDRRTFFFEEPVATHGEPYVSVQSPMYNLYVVTPHLPQSLTHEESVTAQRRILDELISARSIVVSVAWYYTPMALAFSRHIHPKVTVYDCMDELSAFRGAPASLTQLEGELFGRADLVLTGGHSLYESKKGKHPRVHAFPSSVDYQHFAAARISAFEPEDQAPISRPRVGFYGVLDERIDFALIEAAARLRPDVQFVVIGPVVKIAADTLPILPNIHYLGQKSYAELPQYLSGWSVAMMPFALNEATRFISPTKTLEYMAAAKPIISTAIRDVVCPYGEQALVAITGSAQEFVDALDRYLHNDDSARRVRADAYLQGTSWDKTWSRMSKLLERAEARVAKQFSARTHAPSNKETVRCSIT